MNLEDPDFERLEVQWPRDPPRSEEAAVRSNPRLATTTFAREREPPPGGTREYATIRRDEQAAAGIT